MTGKSNSPNMAKNRNKDRDSYEKNVKEGRSFTKLELFLMLLVLVFGIKYANENGAVTSKCRKIFLVDGRSPKSAFNEVNNV